VESPDFVSGDSAMNMPRDHDKPSPAVLTDRSLAKASPDGSEPLAIEVRDLHKSYGEMSAVAGIDLRVRRGEVFAFLGPNGAGKTTTVEILEGFRRRTAGEVSVLGVDPHGAGGEWRSRIGVVLQESEPEPELTVGECMWLYAGYYPSTRSVDETLGLVGLSDRASVRCRDLSGGQRRRLDVALALIGDPELLFLDEPTTGFDPAARRASWDVVAGLRDLGKTIFLTTHYMEEAEYLADRIAVIVKGRIVAEGTARSLGGRLTKGSTIRFTLPEEMSSPELPPTPDALVVGRVNGKVEIETHSPLAVVGLLAGWANERGIDLPDLEVSRPTLEDIYLQLTGEAR
jgi:ABC-2 type transport system ATP-binding protein